MNSTAPSQRILLVDDDKPLSAVLNEYLTSNEYTCDVCHNVRDAKQAVQSTDYQLCLLDVQMPMEDGYSFADYLTNHYKHLPFIFLTGQLSTDERIKGLEAGAADYVVKPFSMRELHLRMLNVLNRSQQKTVAQSSQKINYTIGALTLLPSERTLTNGDQVIGLTWIEVKLLQLFCEDDEGIITREHALSSIWADEFQFKKRSLNVYVSRLRQYLKLDPRIEIKNIHGKGYQLIVRES